MKFSDLQYATPVFKGCFLTFVLFLLRLFVCSINSVSVGYHTFGMLPSCVAFSDSLNSLIYFRVKF